MNENNSNTTFCMSLDQLPSFVLGFSVCKFTIQLMNAGVYKNALIL